MSKIIGIDLGTTNSCAAFVDKGAVKLIPYKGGEFIIPSIFAIDEKGNELIGHEAKRQWQLNPRNTVYATKRLVGRSYSSDVVELMKSQVAYEMSPGERNDVVLDVGTKHFRLAEISAKILAKIVTVAQDYLQEKVHRAVVTVPAYFTDRQRQAVKDAGKMISLEVVRIINEPTAAALAYGVGKNLNETVVIYDLGGGTFDVSIIEIRDRVFEVKATGGDIFLGGIDFDNAMIGHVLKEFYDSTRSTSPPILWRCSGSRISPSARRSTSRPATRAPFSRALRDHDAAGAAAQRRDDLHAQDARGADRAADRPHDRDRRPGDDRRRASRRPTSTRCFWWAGRRGCRIVQERLTDPSGKRALQGRPSGRGRRDRRRALCPLAGGATPTCRCSSSTSSPWPSGSSGGRQFHTVFNRNAAIPNAEVDQRDHQLRQPDGSCDAHLPGRRQVAHNELLGDFLFSGIRPGPAGKARIEVLFDVNIEGILTMRARDLDTGKQMKTTVRVTQRLGKPRAPHAPSPLARRLSSPAAPRASRSVRAATAHLGFTAPFCTGLGLAWTA